MYDSLVRLTKNNFIKQLLDDIFPLDLNIDLFYVVSSLPWIPPHCEGELNEVVDVLDKNKIIYLKSDYLGRL